MKVTIRDRPPPSTRLTVDERQLEQTLRECGGRYSRPEPLRHDINVITAVHRLRNGQKKERLERSDAVFVTTNYPMINASKKFFKDEYDMAGVPRCYSDMTFETLIWLKKPLRAPDLPRRRILADSLAALRPSEALWSSYSQEIERLRQDKSVSEDDFVLLKNSLEAKVELMEVTLGEASAFGEGTIQEVLRRSRAAVQGEAATEIEALRNQLALMDAAASGRVDEIRLRSASIARGLTRGLLYGTVVILVLFVYLTLPSSFNGLSGHLEDLIAPLILVAILIVAILTVLSLGFGASLHSLLQRFQSWLEAKLVKVQFRIAGLPVENVTID